MHLHVTDSYVLRSMELYETHNLFIKRQLFLDRFSKIEFCIRTDSSVAFLIDKQRNIRFEWQDQFFKVCYTRIK